MNLEDNVVQQVFTSANSQPAYELGYPAYLHSDGDTSEKAAIERILQGERELFAELVEPHRRSLLLVALKQTRDFERAEDAVQEAIYKAFTRLHQFRGDAGFLTWITRILINECRMQHRSNRRYADAELGQTTETTDFFSSLSSDAPSVLDQLVMQESREGIRTEISRLPRKFREVVVLRDLHRLSIAETASRLSLTTAAVKSRHFRARLMLQRSLQSDQKRKPVRQ